MKYGIVSDIHYYSKPYRLRSALRLLKDADMVLLCGDISDRGTEQQFLSVFDILTQELPNAALFVISGNHDVREDVLRYWNFEERIFRSFSAGYSIERSRTGAYHVRISRDVDLFGLNPLYDRKLFHFSEHGEQLDFLEKHLTAGDVGHHIVLCHPPLIAHNPQRTPNMQPYLPKEQDGRLQRILNAHPQTMYICGHTHLYPMIETDEHGNIYINAGSICPTQTEKQTEKPTVGM